MLLLCRMYLYKVLKSQVWIWKYCTPFIARVKYSTMDSASPGLQLTIASLPTLHYEILRACRWTQLPTWSSFVYLYCKQVILASIYTDRTRVRTHEDTDIGLRKIVTQNFTLRHPLHALRSVGMNSKWEDFLGPWREVYMKMGSSKA